MNKDDPRFKQKLNALSVEDLIRDRVVFRGMLPLLEAKMVEVGCSPWQAVGHLGWHRLVTSKSETRAWIEVFLEDNPDISDSDLVGALMKDSRGVGNPGQIVAVLKEIRG